MTNRFRLSCGHVVEVTVATLTPEKRRPRVPVEWWCRTCEGDYPIVGRLR